MTDRRAADQSERFHELRRALNSALLQLEVARMLTGSGQNALPAMESVRQQLERLTAVVDDLQEELES